MAVPGDWISDIPACLDTELTEFPLRMRDWLKNVLITLYERDEDNNLLTEKQKLKVRGGRDPVPRAHAEPSPAHWDAPSIHMHAPGMHPLHIGNPFLHASVCTGNPPVPKGVQSLPTCACRAQLCAHANADVPGKVHASAPPSFGAPQCMLLLAQTHTPVRSWTDLWYSSR